MNRPIEPIVASIRGGVHIRSRRGGQCLQLDLFADGERLRKDTGLADTSANRARLQPVVEKLAAAKTLGLLQSSPDLIERTLAAAGIPLRGTRQPPRDVGGTDAFAGCARAWLERCRPQWRESTATTVQGVIDTHLVPAFGPCDVRRITREQVLEFRAALADGAGKAGTPRSRRTINSIVSVLSAILADAAKRYGFASPAADIRRLRTRKSEVQPFRLDQLRALIEGIVPRWRDYILVWAYTGLRTAEINGLRWNHVDLARGLIEVRETYFKGRTSTTKSESGTRDVTITPPVADALRRQFQVTGRGGYVFTSPGGMPVDARNFSLRVWKPLLRQLGLPPRRPYHLRHTYATLMLAAGESPEYVARQLGHSDTSMLFFVYSRYVPNLTRRDGSAFERLLAGAQAGGGLRT